MKDIRSERLHDSRARSFGVREEAGTENYCVTIAQFSKLVLSQAFAPEIT